MTETVSRSASADGWSEPTKASAQSNYIGDKGMGMGFHIPRIVSPITGERWPSRLSSSLGFPTMSLRSCSPCSLILPHGLSQGPGRHGGDHRRATATSTGARSARATAATATPTAFSSSTSRPSPPKVCVTTSAVGGRAPEER